MEGKKTYLKEYYQTDEIQQMIDWENIMKMPRYAGGHDDQMRGLFKNAHVVAHWNEEDYQGSVATCVQLSNGKYAIYNDYYGSCSGCDAWEDATDEEVKNMCVNLSNSTYVFHSLNDVIRFLKNASNIDESYSWKGACSSELLKIIVEFKRCVIIEKIEL